jgi:ubiquinone/menaquinone biosynthesis C-methylase UbiE
MGIRHCRSCHSSSLRVVLDLGAHPLSDALLTSEREAHEQPRYPLRLAFCEGCSLLQVTETIPPHVLFQRDYPYFSSSSPALLRHAAANVKRLILDRNLGSASFVVEVACNDGYLLRNFVESGVPCLGIDPAVGPAEQARKIGTPIINDFFSLTLAEKLAGAGKCADVMIANNVVAHVDAINDFVAGFQRLLKPDGQAVLECAYAVDMIENCEFDTIYHEHLFYHTLHGLKPLFERHGLHLNDVEHLPIHGGSLRVFASRSNRRSTRLEELMERERELGVHAVDWCTGFSARIENLRQSLVELLEREKTNGARIACYGAAAKGSTLVNYLDLKPGFFEFVADANPFKQGRFMPGQAIPIVHPDRLVEAQPDFALLLVWNFAGEVMRQQAAYRAAGGHFIVPIPEPCIIEPGEVVNETHFALTGTSPMPRQADASVHSG